ncbi:MAG: hypothetical protein LQ338_006471 [Usnochroma carphineum]|nr:MAG: hypothetical protein LQ338_006471 [Usnochroma carphineum]
MEVAGQVILPFSPLRQSTTATTPLSMSKNTASSSPGLPSPSKLLMGKVSRLARRDTAIPKTNIACFGSTSAPSLLQLAAPNDQTYSTEYGSGYVLKAREIEGFESKDSKSTKKDHAGGQSKHKIEQRQRGPISVTRLKSNASPKSSTAKAGLKDRDESVLSGKKRAKQSKEDGQTKIKKTNVTKPGAATAKSKRCKGKPIVEGTRCGGPERVEQADIRESKNSSDAQSQDGLGLTDALKRKKDWTPIKKTLLDTCPLSGAEAAWSALIPPGSPSNVEIPERGFGKLVGDFGYADASSAGTARTNETRSISGECATKRRKLNLIANVAPTVVKVAPLKRNISLKKKPQTITDKATAPFVPENGTATSIRDYFGTPALDSGTRSFEAASENQKEEARQGEADISSKKAVKTSKVRRSETKKTKPPVNLVSPETAKKRANEQDLLFGTSSQLAREESPTLIRELQQAYKESEIIDDSLPISREDESQVSHQTSSSDLSKSSSRLPTASRDLWSAAARDDNGSLLNVDIVNLIDTPRPSRSLSTGARKPESEEVAEGAPEPEKAAVDGSWRAVDEMAMVETAAPSTVDLHQYGDSLPLSVAEASLRARPKSRSPVKKPKKPRDLRASATEIPRPEMPSYHGFADADLRKEVAEFGFKPIRRREEMIALLQRCWESRNRVALQSRPPNIPTMSASATDLSMHASESNNSIKKRGRPPKKSSAESGNNGSTDNTVAPPRKPRGRPKKSASAQNPKSKKQTQPSIDDVSAAGCAPPAPSPRQRISAKLPGPLTLSTTLPVAAAAAAQDTEALFQAITKAITSYPPTHDAKKLTWYEKMLLYDPIVVEDLADWLNKEGLSQVEWQDKVTPGMAKRWCESQSVCCVWRESLKGGTRARY